MTQVNADLQTAKANILQLEQEKATLQAEIKLGAEDKAQLEAKIAELEKNASTFQQQLKDKEMEFKIAEKQNLRALKELQTRVRQLQGEGMSRTTSSNNLSALASPSSMPAPAGPALSRTNSSTNVAGPSTPSPSSRKVRRLVTLP